MRENLLDKGIKKVILSPHYDDFVLSLGGLVKKFSEKDCQIEDWIIFSKSNYISKDYLGNQDKSKKRINMVTRIRYKEELQAMKKIDRSKRILCNQNEAPLRGHRAGTRTHQIPRGFKKRMDNQTFKNVQKLIAPLFKKRVQIFVPLAIQEHIDHFIVREAVTCLLLNFKKKIKSQIFFYEDLPYAALANKEEWKRINEFIQRHKLVPSVYSINLGYKLRLLNLYKSQLERSYIESVIKRAHIVAKQEGRKRSCEKVFLYA